MAKEILNMTFAHDSDAKEIINTLTGLVAARSRKEWGAKFIDCSEMDDREYKENNEKTKKAMIAFACNKAGLSICKSEEDMLMAKDNVVFRSVLNSIITQTLTSLTLRYRNPLINEFADMETVPAGASKTYEIDSRALAVAQKANYTSNVTIVPTHAKSGITIKPQMYSLGASLDFIRLLVNDYDWAYDVAKVYAGFVFAKYKACVDLVYSTNVLAGTPFYQATFALATYQQLADDVALFSGASTGDVVALGTRTAFNTITGIATNGGFMTKDEYIRGTYLKEIAGVPSIVVDQFTDGSMPVNSANIGSLRAIPNDIIVLVARGRDKIVKLVQESYIRAIETDAHENNLNRMEYSFFQAFGAGIATSSFFGVQNTANA